MKTFSHIFLVPSAFFLAGIFFILAARERFFPKIQVAEISNFHTPEEQNFGVPEQNFLSDFFTSENVPEGAISGEKILFFESENALQDFLSEAEKRGFEILGVIFEAGIVRVKIDENLDLIGVPAGIVGADYNFQIRVPEDFGENLDDAEARENVVGGRVPVGENALSQMNFFGNSNFGEGVKIAILDSAIFAEHAAFQGAKISQIDVAGGAEDSMNSRSHGTAVASLICGNGVGGIFGAAQNAEILGVRIFDGNGDANSFTAAAGIYAAIEAGAQILNISAGLGNDSAVLKKAVEAAISKGIIVVAAAGNEGVTALAYPAAYAGTLAVGAVDAENSSAPFSNIGENLLAVAPGVGINAAGTADSGTIISFTGTSASAPLFAGILAAAISDSAELKTAFDAKILAPEDVSERICESADDLGEPGFDEIFGAGILNYERLSRPSDAQIFDISVNDFYAKNGSGGNVDPAIFILLQNRGSVWAESSFQAVFTFFDGKREVLRGNLKLQPGESVSRGAVVPEKKFRNGVRVDVKLIVPGGAIFQEKSTYFDPETADN